MVRPSGVNTAKERPAKLLLISPLSTSHTFTLAREITPAGERVSPSTVLARMRFSVGENCTWHTLDLCDFSKVRSNRAPSGPTSGGKPLSRDCHRTQSRCVRSHWAPVIKRRAETISCRGAGAPVCSVVPVSAHAQDPARRVPELPVLLKIIHARHKTAVQGHDRFGNICINATTHASATLHFPPDNPGRRIDEKDSALPMTPYRKHAFSSPAGLEISVVPARASNSDQEF
jgi:hypothetical protein